MPARTADRSSRTVQHVTYILVAEFDIDAGAILSHQYPYPTGADKQLLAELMLPEGVHHRSEDWTVFFLNQNALNTITSVFPRHSMDSDVTAMVDERPELIYGLSLVRTKHDAAAKRKAHFKAMALCTQHPYIQIFKPVLSLALDQYSADPSVDCLSRLFDDVNGMDLSLAPSLTHLERLILRASDRSDMFAEKFIMPHQLGRGDADSAKMTSSDDGSDGSHTKVEGGELGEDLSRSRATSVTSLSETGSVGRRSIDGQASRGNDWVRNKRPSFDRVSTASSTGSRRGAGLKSSVDSHEHKRPHRPRDTHFFDTSIMFKGVAVPIKIPLSTFKDEVGDYSLVKLIQTFSSPTAIVTGPMHPHLHTNGTLTHPVILLFNALITEKNVIFLGTGRPASHVVDYVLAACALGTGGYLRGLAERAYPYATLAIREMIELTTGYVAGVTNPIFESFSTWDILCNIETGRITVNKDIKQPNYSPVLLSPAAFGRPAAPRPDPIMDEDDENSKPVHMLNGGSTGPSKVDYSARPDASDNMFMEDLLLAINAHYGEAVVRMRIGDFILRFTRLAALYEEEAFGETHIGFHNANFSNGELGAGVGILDEIARARELSPNCQQRIEAWRRTKCYQYFVQDFRSYIQHRAIRGYDVVYQISRLRTGKNMSAAEALLIMRSLRDSVSTYEQVIELLALLPPSSGGLLPITFCLFHPQELVREAAVDFLDGLKTHRVGELFKQSLNMLHRLAYRRLAQSRTAEADVARRNTVLAATAFGIPSAAASIMSGTPSNQSASSLVS